MTTMPFGEQQYVAPAIQPMNGTATVTVPTGEDELTNVGADGVEYADPLEALLFAPDEDIFKMPTTEEEEETTEQNFWRTSGKSRGCMECRINPPVFWKRAL